MKTLYKSTVFLSLILLLTAYGACVQPPPEPVNENLTLALEPSENIKGGTGNMAIENAPQVGVGYTNLDGSRLIVLYNHEFEDNSLLTYFDYAVGENGNVYEIEYDIYQDWGENDNGRQSARNFANQRGCVYRFVHRIAIEDNTYVLIPEDESGKRIIFQENKDADRAAFTEELIEKCAGIANRNVKKGWLLSVYHESYWVSIIEFENIDRDLLAWLILENEDGFFQYCELPATLSEDGLTGWRYEDRGELMREAFYILCVIQEGEDIMVYLGWYDEEGETISLIEFSPDKTPFEKTIAGRYTIF